MKFWTRLTEPECDRYRQLCNFSDVERAIFDMRVKDASIVSIGLKLCLSEATVKRRLHDIKYKIDKVS